MIIVAAGPVANFVLAAVLFALLFAFTGKPVTVPVVGDVVADSPAAKAGLQAGDRIVSIAGQPISRFEDIQGIVSHSAGVSLALSISRDGKTIETTAIPKASGKVGILGIRGGKVEYEPVSLFAAIPEGISETYQVSVATLQGIGQMLTGTRSTDELGGPLKIAQLSGQVAALGFKYLINLIAVLSVNLGLLNLFPVPVLDGGHLVFYTIEAIRGRPMSARRQDFAFKVGLALIVSLFVFVTRNDIMASDWFQHLMKLI